MNREHASIFARTWSVIVSRPLALFGVVLMIYVPFYAVYEGSVFFGLLPEEAAEHLFSLLQALVAPLANAVIVWRVHAWSTTPDLVPSLADSFNVARRSWSRQLTTYISISFILIGWIALTCLPVFLVLHFLGFDQIFLTAPVAVVSGVYVMSRYIFVDSLVVLEGLGAWEARRRSAEWVKGRRLVIIGYAIAGMGIPVAIEIGAQYFAPAIADALQVHKPIVLAIAGIFTSALYVVPVIIFYYLYIEQRVTAERLVALHRRQA